MHSSERWIAGALFTVALLAFFFPLASLELPVVGKIEASGYDFLSKSRQFEDRLGNLNNQTSEGGTEAPPRAEAPHAIRPFPVSIQTIPLLPIEILGSFGLSAVALLLCIAGTSRGGVKLASTIAGVLGIGSILHIVIADSDLHAWIQAQMQTDTNAMRDNPFAALAQNIGSLIANAVHFRPGSGLYALAASVSVGALLLHSGLIFRSCTDVEADQVEETPHHEAGRRLFAFTVIAAIVIGAAAFVLEHRVPNQVPTQSPSTPTRTPTVANSRPNLTQEPAIDPGETAMRSRLVAALTELSAKQGHNHTYSMCNENTLCVMDTEAPDDGFMENFISNTPLAGKLYDAGFRSLVIANGSHAWGWNVTSIGYSSIPDANQVQEALPEQ
jgi:hypothetical protein